jgi:hypothetical protein
MLGTTDPQPGRIERKPLIDDLPLPPSPEGACEPGQLRTEAARLAATFERAFHSRDAELLEAALTTLLALGDAAAGAVEHVRELGRLTAKAYERRLWELGIEP